MISQKIDVLYTVSCRRVAGKWLVSVCERVLGKWLVSVCERVLGKWLVSVCVSECWESG